jgi:hypothetical protein
VKRVGIFVESIMAPSCEAVQDSRHAEVEEDRVNM